MKLFNTQINIQSKSGKMAAFTKTQRIESVSARSKTMSSLGLTDLELEGSDKFIKVNSMPLPS